MKHLKEIVKKLISLIPFEIIEVYLMSRFRYSPLSFSQHGEDIILKDLFPGKKNGFYVDVGAHHPTIFSNTYLLYRMGWKGINIDSAPGCMESFKRTRPRDINLEIAVAAKNQMMEYFVFDKSALNTLSPQRAQHLEKMGHMVKNTMKIHTSPLREILRTNIPPNGHIDFMTIDVEKLDLEVLQSNDWNAFRPDVVAVEDGDFDIENIYKSEIFRFMKEKGYRLKAALMKTVFFDNRI